MLSFPGSGVEHAFQLPDFDAVDGDQLVARRSAGNHLDGVAVDAGDGREQLTNAVVRLPAFGRRIDADLPRIAMSTDDARSFTSRCDAQTNPGNRDLRVAAVRYHGTDRITNVRAARCR